MLVIFVALGWGNWVGWSLARENTSGYRLLCGGRAGALIGVFAFCLPVILSLDDTYRAFVMLAIGIEMLLELSVILILCTRLATKVTRNFTPCSSEEGLVILWTKLIMMTRLTRTRRKASFACSIRHYTPEKSWQFGGLVR